MSSEFVIPKSKKERRILLSSAIEKEDRVLIKSLIDMDNSLLESSNAHGNNTPLELALEIDLELADYLIKLGANPHATNHGGSSLMDKAANNGDSSLVDYLKQHGVKYTIHHASCLDDIEGIKMILKEDNAALDSKKKSRLPIHLAASCGANKVLTHLIDKDQDVNAMDKEGFAPLSYSVRNKNLESSKILLKNGADPNSSGTYSGGTVLHRALSEGDYSGTELLLKFKADPNLRDNYGKTALHIAVTKNLQLAELVLSHGPDLSMKANDGNTPLELAIKKKKKSIVKRITN